MLRPYSAGLTTLGEDSRTRGGGTGAGGQRPVAGRAGLLDGFESLRAGHQRCGSLALDRAAGGKRDGDGRRPDVIRHFGDDHNVEFAKGEKRVVDTPAKLFDWRTHGFDAVLWMGNEPRPSFRRVAHLTEVMRHVSSSTCVDPGEAGGRAREIGWGIGELCS